MALTPKQVEEVENLLVSGRTHHEIHRLTRRARGTIAIIAKRMRQAKPPAPKKRITHCDKHNTDAVDGRCVACTAEEWLAQRQRRLPGQDDVAELALDPVEYCPDALALARDQHLEEAAEGDGPTEARYGRLAEDPPLPIVPPRGSRVHLEAEDDQ